MKVLLLGGYGMLGHALRATCPATVQLEVPMRAALDASDAAAVAKAGDAHTPDWIINCAAYTAVDAAESDEAEATRLNVRIPEAVGAAAAARGARVVHFSTDYVFNGESTRPWREDDPCSPQSAYGRTKLAGERALLATGAACLILRTAWLFGEQGKNFPRTMWERALAGQPARVVDDQRGAPTSTRDLAQWCWALIAAEARGIVHATNAGEASWAEVAEHVYAAAGRPGLVTRVSSAEYPTPAKRPRYSVLDGSRLESLLGAPRRSWTSALDEYLVTLNQRSAA